MMIIDKIAYLSMQTRATCALPTKPLSLPWNTYVSIMRKYENLSLSYAQSPHMFHWPCTVASNFFERKPWFEGDRQSQNCHHESWSNTRLAVGLVYQGEHNNTWRWENIVRGQPGRGQQQWPRRVECPQVSTEEVAPLLVWQLPPLLRRLGPSWKRQVRIRLSRLPCQKKPVWVQVCIWKYFT